MHEALFVTVLLYGSETDMKKRERPRIRAVQLDKFRALLDIRRMDRVPNAWIRELDGIAKGVNERMVWPY